MLWSSDASDGVCQRDSVLIEVVVGRCVLRSATWENTDTTDAQDGPGAADAEDRTGAADGQDGTGTTDGQDGSR